MSGTTTHENNRKFYDRISGMYDGIADANERAARVAGLQALDLKPGERIVEIGFGTGNEIVDMAQLVGKDGFVAGIDISEGMLAVARKKLSPPPEATVELHVADARKLPFLDNVFDAAYSSFTLELFPAEDIPLVLAEAKRVLRPGGRIGIVSMATVKAGQTASMLEKTYIWMHQHFPHIVDCRPIDVAGVITAAGFRIVKTIDMEIWTLPVMAVVAEKP